MKKVAITRRIDPCGCGCQGGDPWHAREFVRHLSNIRSATGKAKTLAYSQPVEIRAEATARLPWGEGRPVRVVEVDMEGHSLGWFATRDVL